MGKEKIIRKREPKEKPKVEDNSVNSVIKQVKCINSIGIDLHNGFIYNVTGMFKTHYVINDGYYNKSRFEDIEDIENVDIEELCVIKQVVCIEEFNTFIGKLGEIYDVILIPNETEYILKQNPPVRVLQSRFKNVNKLSIEEHMKQCDDIIGNINIDMVNHPPHYTSHPSGIECIDVIREYPYSVGVAMKYLWRAGLKKDPTMFSKAKEIEDLEKAIWYINDRIKQLKDGREKTN